MGKYYVFLLIVICTSCASRSSQSMTSEEQAKHAARYDKLCAKASKARQDYLEKVDKKSKGMALERARQKMLKTEEDVEKYKAHQMAPKTKHLHRTH